MSEDDDSVTSESNGSFISNLMKSRESLQQSYNTLTKSLGEAIIRSVSYACNFSFSGKTSRSQLVPSLLSKRSSLKPLFPTYYLRHDGRGEYEVRFLEQIPCTATRSLKDHSFKDGKTRSYNGTHQLEITGKFEVPEEVKYTHATISDISQFDPDLKSWIDTTQSSGTLNTVNRYNKLNDVNLDDTIETVIPNSIKFTLWNKDERLDDYIARECSLKATTFIKDRIKYPCAQDQSMDRGQEKIQW